MAQRNHSGIQQCFVRRGSSTMGTLDRWYHNFKVFILQLQTGWMEDYVCREPGVPGQPTSTASTFATQTSSKKSLIAFGWMWGWNMGFGYEIWSLLGFVFAIKNQTTNTPRRPFRPGCEMVSEILTHQKCIAFGKNNHHHHSQEKLITSSWKEIFPSIFSCSFFLDIFVPRHFLQKYQLFGIFWFSIFWSFWE